MTMVARWFLFRPKNPNWGIFWRTLEWKMLLHFLVTWNILRPFGYIKCAFGNFSSFGTFFPALVYLHQEKSGNPAYDARQDINIELFG
jgi:hypothetical protein